MSEPKGFYTSGVYHTPAGMLVRRWGHEPGHVILVPGRIDEIVRYMRERRLDGLEVNRSLCEVRPRDLALLERFPFVRRLVIIHGTIRLDAINHMSDLEELTVDARCLSPLDFRSFPKLRVLRSNWVRGALSAFECKRLEDLFLTDWQIHTIDAIQHLPRLRRLTVSGGSLRTFALDDEVPLEELCLMYLRSLTDAPGLQRLVRLKQLEMSHLPKLSSLPPLGRLRHLGVVKCEKVKKLSNVERLGELLTLRKMVFVDMGNIKTLRFLARARRLAELWVIYNSRIRDGDLSFVRKCRSLRHVKIDESRLVQYDPPLESVTRIVSRRAQVSGRPKRRRGA